MENRRQYLRYKIEIEARIYTADLNLSVTVVNISEDGIGIISEKPVEIGNKISISLFPIIEDPIVVTPVWSFYFEKDQKYYHRIGIETEHLALEKMKAFGFPIISKFVSETISQNNKNGKLDWESIE
ncbi:MAG: PilZ domain-containing protein [Desulfobacterales bacterium]|nr:PilZ domain-containing protein [Desulfobacterales bacterium]